MHPTAHVGGRLHACVALPGADAPDPGDLSFCVLGPGPLRVTCDEATVREEQALGSGGPVPSR